MLKFTITFYESVCEYDELNEVEKQNCDLYIMICDKKKKVNAPGLDLIENGDLTEHLCLLNAFFMMHKILMMFFFHMDYKSFIQELNLLYNVLTNKLMHKCRLKCFLGLCLFKYLYHIYSYRTMCMCSFNFYCYLIIIYRLIILV